MKYFIIIITLLSLIVIKSSAQTITPLTLTYHRKLLHIKELPFNKVIVFDNRFDTAKIKIREYGGYPLYVMNFDTSSTISIKKYIETAITNFPKKNQLLYINIKQLRFENVYPRFLFFSADAYFKVNDRFKKIATIKKSYEIHMHGYEDSSYRRTITRALNELVETVNINYYNQNNDENNADTFDTFNTNVMNEWKNFPIIIQNIYTNGVFETFDDFKNNVITPLSFSMQMNTDSIFFRNFSENSRYYNKSRNQYKHMYAVSYNNSLYIPTIGRYFLALNKINNTFYFNVPYSLPNMYSIVSERLLKTPNVTSNQLTSSANPYIALIGGAVGIAKQIKVDKQVRSEKQEIINKGLVRGDLRTCFLDMDTGDIIYY